MDDAPQNVCPDCGDSPLSTTGNVLGILTFALGVFAYLAVFFAMTRGAENEIRYCARVLAETEDHIKEIEYYKDLLTARGDQDARRLRDAMDTFRRTYSKIQQDLDNFKDRCGIGNTDLSDEKSAWTASTWTRINWWYVASNMTAQMGRLDSHKQHFAAIELTVILR